MKLTLTKTQEVPLLARKRVIFQVDYDGSATPKKDDVTKAIATSMKVGEDVVKLQHIYPRYGKSYARIIAHVYNSASDLANIETVKKKKKDKTKKAKGKK